MTRDNSDNNSNQSTSNCNTGNMINNTSQSKYFKNLNSSEDYSSYSNKFIDIENLTLGENKKKHFPNLILLPLMYFIVHIIVLIFLLAYNNSYITHSHSDLVSHGNEIKHTKKGQVKIKEKLNILSLSKQAVKTPPILDSKDANAKNSQISLSTHLNTSPNSNSSSNINRNINDSETTKIIKAQHLVEKNTYINNSSNASSITTESLVSKLNFLNILSNYTFTSFFDLLNVNVKVFFVSSCITSLIGFLILIIIYSILKQRYNVPEFKTKFINLYIMLSLGIVTVFLNFLLGAYPFYLKYFQFKDSSGTHNKHDTRLGKQIDEKIFESFDSEKEYAFKMLLFLSYICLSCIYSISVISNVQLLKKIKSVNSNVEYRFSLKILNLFAIVLFTSFYILSLLNSKGYIFISCEIIDNKALIYLIPYIIYLFLGLLNFSFYFELKYITYRMSRNMEVDYLFDDNDKMINS